MSDFGGVHKEVVQAALSAPYLQREEERDLASRWSDARDEEALHALVSSHIRLVIAIASRFRHYGLPVADMIQEGHLGLLEAAARFEPEREVRFSTYAAWWIRAAVQDYVLRNRSIVRGGTSSSQKSLFFNLRRLRARLSQAAAEDTSIDIHARIAAALGVSRKDVETMEARLSGPDISLNAPPTAGDADKAAADRQEFLIDASPLPDEVVAEEIDTHRRAGWLKLAMMRLTERERMIIEARRLREDEPVTLEAVGKRLGISKERVRQIEARALDKLRQALEREPAGAFMAYA
jgi:RNA polymerase sigma-32 factor